MASMHIPKNFSVPPLLKNERTQAYTTLTLTLFALSFFGLFAINPSLSTIAQLQKKLEDSRYVNQKLLEKIANMRSLQTQYSLIENDVPLVLRAIPKQPTVPILIGQIQSLAVQSSVTLTKLQSFQVELAPVQENPEKYASFNVSLEASGPFENISLFLSSLTQFDRIFTPDTITLLRSASTGTYSMSLRGKVYYKK